MMNITDSKSEVYQVPGLDANELNTVAEKTFERYTTPSLSGKKRDGNNGVAILWFRNDLRVVDNEALYKSWVSSHTLLPVYCVDPRLFHTTHYFSFQKTGAVRAAFLIECLADLKKNLIKRGLDLLIRYGKPEDVLPSLAKDFGAHTVFAHKETCSEELMVERLVHKALKAVGRSSSRTTDAGIKLQLVWGSTLFHIDGLPFSAVDLPDVYTQFRKSVEAKCSIRGCIRNPNFLGPPPHVDDWGVVPTLDQLGLHLKEVSKGMRFIGGETAALGRVFEYLWKKARENLDDDDEESESFHEWRLYPLFRSL